MWRWTEEGGVARRQRNPYAASVNDPHHPMRALAAAVVAAVFLLLPAMGGCAASRITDPSRTATEQFLMSQAATRAVEQLTFHGIAGRSAWLDTTHYVSSEPMYVIGEVRSRMLHYGVRLVDRREDADVIVELRSGGVGIDRDDYLFGIPAFLIPAGTTTGTPNTSLVTPELALFKRVDQKGVASVAYVAYRPDTGQFIASDGPKVGRSNRDDLWFFGFGPSTSGDIATTGKDETFTGRAGRAVPVPNFDFDDEKPPEPEPQRVPEAPGEPPR